MKKLCTATSLLVFCFTCLLACREQPLDDTPGAVQPHKIKAVVVTMFEIGADEGDKAGEFQLWKAGQKLTTRFDFPHSHHDIFANLDTGVLGIVTGMGTAKAASAIMALGLDPRFDLSEAYWLVAGIAGVDPHDASIGSAVWATWLVDGDLAHEIDAREIPKDWSTGYFPLFSHAPYPNIDESRESNGEVYQLNSDLSEWAYQLTKDTQLVDTNAMQVLRKQYTKHENARLPPKVLKGDHLAAATFWHGKLMNEWANKWTHLWTEGKGNFVTSGMEDTGTYQSISYLHNAKKADKNRVLVLRTASNYVMPPSHLSAAENLAMESSESGFVGLQASIEAAYMVGSQVIEEIVNNWHLYQTTVPHAYARNTER